MQAFNLTEVPLDGWNLLEANAGTGKTYSICALFLRLMLERGISHDQIVTITFTRAATGELKTRLLQTLLTARNLLADPPELARDNSDPLAQICRPFHADEAAISRIDHGVRSFDLTPVLTIHGLCQRLLTEASLTTGFNPDSRVADSVHETLGEVVQRVWQDHVSTLSEPLIRALKAFDKTKLTAEISTLLARPYARHDYPELIDPGELWEQAIALRARALALWQQHEAEIRDLLSAARPDLNQRSYKPEQVSKLLQLVAKWLPSSGLCSSLKEVSRLGQSQLTKATKKAATSIPEHALFSAIDDCVAAETAVDEAVAAYRRNLGRLLLPEVKRRMAIWKQANQALTFDDLMLKLQAALQDPPAATALIQHAGKRYGALLVDEYQDTDPIQAVIFQRLFEPMGVPVWRVGDPKQSLYGFRGADLHAYLATRDATPNCYQLTMDWRAQPGLVACINAVFSADPQPFVLPEIQFAPAFAAPREPLQLMVDGVAAAPMTVWRTDGGESGRETAMTSSVHQIAALLSGARDGRVTVREGDQEQPLKAQQIAVLVRTNTQAERVEQALRASGIGAARPGGRSVFASAEASELERLLHGVAQPFRQDKLSGALATRLLGFDAGALDQWRADQAAQDRWADRFRSWRDVWVEQGVYALLLTVFRQTHCAGWLLPLDNGDAVLTNLMHLSDLMETHAATMGLSIDEQIAWLNQQRENPADRSEDRLVRLDRAADVVQIATIHRAKGAQYPVVFCPFLWQSGQRKSSFVEVHEDNNLVLDFGTDRETERSAQASREFVSENARLAYVAMTRAQAALYVPWFVNGYTGTANCGLSHLLDALAPAPATDKVDKKNRYGPVIGRHLAGFSKAGAQVLGEPPAFVGRLRMPRVWPRHREPLRRPQHQWLVTSYSGLFSGAAQDRDLDQRVDLEVAPMLPGDTSIAALPAGSHTGLMIHDLLENLPGFDQSYDELLSQAQSYLRRYALDPRFAPALARSIAELLHQPLGPDQVTLAKTGLTDQLREMEFHLHVPNLDPDKLWRTIRSSNPPPQFSTAVVTGFLHGFIDLVVKWQERYWVIDYKSTRLGNHCSDYSPARLDLDVHSHHYDFQYYLYLLALDQHLTQCLPGYQSDTHMGGVLYLYVRGIDGSGNGVHHRSPDPSLLNELRKLLLK